MSDLTLLMTIIIIATSTTRTKEHKNGYHTGTTLRHHLVNRIYGYRSVTGSAGLDTRLCGSQA